MYRAQPTSHLFKPGHDYSLSISWLCMLLSTLLLASCGGGGDSSNVAGVGSGGTGSSSYATGAVSGFGSVIVNGIHYDVSQAQIMDAWGHLGKLNDLELGMTVAIEGTAPINDQAKANVVQYASVLIGAMSNEPDVLGNSLTALGQHIDMTPTTVFDDQLAGLADLHTGDDIEVYGLTDGTGKFIATRIERKTGYKGYYKVTGLIKALNLANATIELTGLPPIRYSAANLQTTLMKDKLVTVWFSKGRLDQPLTAVKIESHVDKTPQNNQEVFITGVLSADVKNGRIIVNGLPIQLRPEDLLKLGLRLTKGTLLQIQGRIKNGVLTAEKITIKSSPSAPINQDKEADTLEATGLIQNLDPIKKIFKVRTVVVNYAFYTGSLIPLREAVCITVKSTQLINGSQLLPIKKEDLEIKNTKDCR